MSETLIAALAYAEEGIPVFPCRPDKKPATANGFKDATTDPDIIRAWFKNHPAALIGRPTGAMSGVVVVDLDVDGDKGLDANDGWAALLNGHPAIDTWEALTPRGGRHLYFRHPGQDIQCSASKLAPGIDVRGDGGYVIAPPSVLPDGRGYQWEASSDPADGVPLADVPGWLLALLAKKPQEEKKPGAADEGAVLEGGRNAHLARLAGSLRRPGFGFEAIFAALMAENNARCSPPLDEEEVRTIARSVSRYEPEPDDGHTQRSESGSQNDVHDVHHVHRAEEVATISAAIEALSDDPGAVLTEAARQAWGAIYDADPAEFERLRKRAKEGGARVTEIDKLVRARNRRPCAATRNYFGSNPSDPSDTRAESIHHPSGDHPKSDECFAPDALLEYSDKGIPSRMIDSRAAEIVGAALRSRLAWDGDAQSWLLWAGTHWEPLTVASAAERLLADAVHIGTQSLGYRVAYLNGITAILQRRGLLAPRPVATGLIPFRNGLLDTRTTEVAPATPDRAMTWCLPHDWDPAADCPTIKTWLLRSVEGDAETVELLRAWLAALVRGLSLQKFLLLLGRGGSGKGTFQRLAVALVGVLNTATSALRDLEENRFETAKLYGKRLCLINEAGRHGGTLNMLKAITGGDHIPLERKHVQQSGSFVFDGLILMASNEDLQSTDNTSGLERRRITVRFPTTATPEEKADWESRGGEQAVLHAEIPGLIRWLLELPEADIRARFEHPPARVVADNLLGMAAGNSVADWLMECTTPAPGEWSQVGVKAECRDRDTGETYYKHENEWLYPSYLKWCLAHGRSRPVALRKFRDTVADMAEHLGYPITHGRHPVTRAASVCGLRLSGVYPSDTDGAGWAKGRTQDEVRMGRMDGRQNFGPENCASKKDTDSEVNRI